MRNLCAKLHIFDEKSVHLNLFSYFCSQIIHILWKLNDHYYSFPTMTVIRQRVSTALWRCWQTMVILSSVRRNQPVVAWPVPFLLNSDGTLLQPETKWGGMMRKIDTNDFEQANIEYIEFWLLDPFIYTREEGTASEYSGDLYFNLGEVSEDILRDGKKFYESGMTVDGSQNFTTTQWGKIPVQATQTYAFATTTGSRKKQDTGFNGLT